MPKFVTVHRSGGEPVRFRLRDHEALTTLMIEFQEAMTGSRSKTVQIIDPDGGERTILLNGSQMLAVELTEE